MELIGGWIEDLIQEQYKFQQHTKAIAKPRSDHMRWLTKRIQENKERREAGDELLSLSFETSGLKPLPEAPPRVEPLLMIGQLDRYCEQVNADAVNTMSKLFVTQVLTNN
jgi:hypothetical protein